MYILTFLFQKGKHLGIQDEDKEAVVKFAMTADVHTSAQSLIQGDVPTKAGQPSQQNVHEAEPVVDPPEPPSTKQQKLYLATLKQLCQAKATPKQVC